jgi:GTPase SAR1 family protein
MILPWKFAGFNVETVEYKNISFTVWDVGGQDKVRKSIHDLLVMSDGGIMPFLC